MSGLGDVHEMTAVAQAAAIRGGELRPRELVEHYLSRIEALDRAVGAFVTVTADRALAAADAAERTLRAERDGLPPLFGVPTAIKDLNLTAGIRTTLGSRLYQDFVPPIDDHVVTRLAAAGTISLGKTNAPEFGLPCYTEPDVAPPARTPWDPQRSAGGSSGGAGAAVAAGLVPVAQGSDGAGSIRIPASVCGLVGLKTSRGRVSNGPIYGDLAGLVVNGPLARTVEDAAALLDAMAGPEVGDPYWAPPLPPGRTFRESLRTPVQPLRVGWYQTPVISEATVHPECEAALKVVVALLGELGHDVVDIDPPFGAEHVPAFETLWAVAATRVPVGPGDEAKLRPLTRFLRERGMAVGAAAYGDAITGLRQVAAAAMRATAGLDAVVTPTLAGLPAPVGGLRNDDDPLADFEAQKRFTPFTAPYNLSGQPVISLPLYWTADGLPVGLQFVGRPADEVTLLRLAAQLEEARPWAHRRPRIW
jgi:amidase